MENKENVSVNSVSHNRGINYFDEFDDFSESLSDYFSDFETSISISDRHACDMILKMKGLTNE